MNTLDITFSFPQWIMLAGIVFVLVMRTLYLFLYRKAIFKPTNSDDPDLTPPLSVIVYACNDANYIRENLPLILEQDYPCFEVIVVNDGSTDETNEELKLLEMRYPNLYHTYLPEEAKTQSRRKLALSMAVKAANYDWLVMTTANSSPVSVEWLRSLARNMDDQADVVLAYSGLTTKGSAGMYYRMDNLFFQLRYLAMAVKGKPYMGVGNNLAFRKTIYQQRVFSGLLNISVGEDDVPVNRIANSGNTRVELSPGSVVKVHYENLSKAWRERKMGYSLTRKFYKNRSYRLWEIEPIFRYLFWILSVVSAIYGFLFHWLFLLLVLLFATVYYLIYYYTINRLAHQFSERRCGISLVRREFSQPFVDLFYKKKGRKYPC
ncbi:MAG: glycosyltransferase [Bacteroidales bacterium]